jgi:hypothetical protein
MEIIAQKWNEGIMSATILTKNFTPLMDSMIRKYGVMTAAVFGRVWRYCLGENKVCNAAISTIADELNLSYATTLRHVKILVKDGYLDDLSPNLRNHPHTYRDTGKAGLDIEIIGHDNSTLSNLEGTLSNLEGTLSKSASDSINLIDEDRIESKKEFKIDATLTDSLFGSLSLAFEQAACITFHNDPKWVKAIGELVKLQATPAIIESAVKLLREKDYTVVGPWSITTAVRNMIGKQAGKANPKVIVVDTSKGF